MRILHLGVITLGLLFLFGCKYGMSDNPVLVDDNPDLFDKRGRSLEAIGIDAGNNRFLVVIPRGVKGSVAEAINITRAVDAKEASKVSNSVCIEVTRIKCLKIRTLVSIK